MTKLCQALFLSAVWSWRASLLAAIVPFSPVDETVRLLPDAQKRVMSLAALDERIAFFSKESQDGRALRRAHCWQRSEQVVFSWRATVGEKGPWRIELGKRKDLSDARRWFVRVRKTDAATGRETGAASDASVIREEFPRANLEVGTEYFWRVSSMGGGLTNSSPVASFRTEGIAPRWISLEGRVGNVRDLGGRIGCGGKRVRQGLIYRGQGLNDNSVCGDVQGRNRLTVEDVAYLTRTLGVRTDLDLRSKGETADLSVSPLGSGVNLILRSSPCYRGIFERSGMKTMAENFRVFCDEANYPIYFHCIGGADRTGALAYVLNGVLGVSRQELETDWESTFYPNIPDENPDPDFWCRESHFNAGFARYGGEGTSWNDRIVLYLKDCGVTDGEIAKFRSLMLEGGAAPALAANADGFRRCRVRGNAPPHTWIVSNTGEITQADKTGRYELTLPVQGFYCLKAMKDGYCEQVRPWLRVPTDDSVDFVMWAQHDPDRKVYHADLGHPAQLLITDSGAPVLGFDLAGTPVGSFPARKGVWHHRNPYFWTLGEYCFTATGKVSVVETPDFPDLRKRGWYKGDFHAHIVHGENFYRANLQQMNFVCRAAHFDWIWLSQDHSNDGMAVDHESLARYLSDGKLLLRVNNEFPKNLYGHFGNLGVGPIWTDAYGPDYDEDAVTNLELAEKTVYARGGLCVPVHPLYGDVVRVDKATGRKRYGMINNGLLMWLMCRPELVPVVDFFYFPEVRAEKFWYRLLNRGYTLACSGTSDAAFDVGVAPGDSHATFAKLERVDGPSVVQAFREGRTMVSYHGSAVLFEIDGKTSGDVLRPGPQKRRMDVDAYADPGRDFAVEIIRNGRVLERREFKAPADGHFSFARDIVEDETSWYVVVLRKARDEKPRAVASPVYFRGADFRAPERIPLVSPLPQKIRDRIKFLTPEEVDSDAWYDELARLLKEASESKRQGEMK